MQTHRTRRRFLTHLGAVATALIAPPIFAQATPHAEAPALGLSTAINLAGRQRMLSQRSAKGWLMVADGVLPERGAKWLEESIARFDEGLARLKGLQPTEEIRSSLVQLEQAWAPYVAILRQPPTKARAQAVFDGSDQVLAIAHQTTKAYEAQVTGAIGNLINIAGRQRMLSQRMAKFYFFERIDIQPEASRLALEKAALEFTEAMKVLRESGQTTEAIAAELALTDQQWFFFDAAMKEPAGERAAKNIATTSERILQQLDLVVARYEALAS